MDNYGKQIHSIDGVQYGEFKGNKTISIPFGKNNEEFKFGKTKARAIVKYFKDIEKFAEEEQAKL
jgi:hypothetical protein